MKKNVFFALLSALFLIGCVDFNEPTPAPEIVKQIYTLTINNRVSASPTDTVYAGTNQSLLALVTDRNEKIVESIMDFGDGSTLEPGTQIIHKYLNPGIYQFSATITGTNPAVVMKRVIKVTSPSVSSVETIMLLSGNTVGDSAALKILCLKNKIYKSGETKGTYYLKGDLTDWKYSIQATDTNYVANGNTYLMFNIKVKNGSWTSFGYYKKLSDATENWGYDPQNKYWDTSRGLYKIFVSGAQIHTSELTAQTPGACGDGGTSSSGPTIRLDYQTNGLGNDSLVVYANRNYLTPQSDPTKLGISYSVDGGTLYTKRGTLYKDTYIFIKIPVSKNSTVRFKTYKDISTLVAGDMSSSIFYDSAKGDCYLTIAGTMQSAPAVNGVRTNKGVYVFAANGDKLNF